MFPSSSQQKPTRRRREIDILAVGEILVDLISHHTHENLGNAVDFRRYQGGSAANLAANMARLGNTATFIGCVGTDGLGSYLIQSLENGGLSTEYVIRHPHVPTTLVLLTKTRGTPDFIVYRAADKMLEPKHIPETLLQESTLFHTTCFALSQPPARETILNAAHRARGIGCQLSIDVNYAPEIWPDRLQAQTLIAQYCQMDPLVKMSRDDVRRLWDRQDMSDQQACARLHQWGAGTVCLTRGEEGCIISWEHGRHQEILPAPVVKVVDATGAGDAFWAGFLTAWLEGLEPLACAGAGIKIAKIKLERIGPLPKNLKIHWQNNV